MLLYYYTKFEKIWQVKLPCFRTFFKGRGEQAGASAGQKGCFPEEGLKVGFTFALR